jgi:hypothetical protein
MTAASVTYVIEAKSSPSPTFSLTKIKFPFTGHSLWDDSSFK